MCLRNIDAPKIVLKNVKFLGSVLDRQTNNCKTICPQSWEWWVYKSTKVNTLVHVILSPIDTFDIGKAQILSILRNIFIFLSKRKV